MNLVQLEELGFSDGQIAVYSACLTLGNTTINALQEKTGIDRRNIYDILNKLIEKGYISYTEEHGRRTYTCTHPNKIKEEIKHKRAALDTLAEQIPDAVAIYNEAKIPIGAQVYRGNEAMKALLDEALEHDASYWIGGNSGVENTNLKFWFKHWMERRVERKHAMYDLVDADSFLEGLKPNDLKKHKAQHYKYCALPKNLSSPMVVVIFGNKVAQILWSNQSFAFVLESKEIKDSFMKYFHHFWKEPR
jgi:sugar-specific transcriptional regulator TrmB